MYLISLDSGYSTSLCRWYTVGCTKDLQLLLIVACNFFFLSLGTQKLCAMLTDFIFTPKLYKIYTGIRRDDVSCKFKIDINNYNSRTSLTQVSPQNYVTHVYLRTTYTVVCGANRLMYTIGPILTYLLEKYF